MAGKARQGGLFLSRVMHKAVFLPLVCMKIALKVLLVILSCVYGGVFIYSAYTKAFPIQPFEYTLVEFLHMPWLLAAIVARFFIGFEAGIGLLMVINLYGKNKWVPKLSAGMLVVFSAYLIYLWGRFGNSVNCGCFGDAILMSPAASLIKNAVLLVATLIIIRFHDSWQHKWAYPASQYLFLACVTLPYLVLSIPPSEPNWLKSSGYVLDFSPLYVPAHEPVNIDLRKGKHVVAYISQTCPHCRIAAYKMHLMKQANPSLPFFMIIGQGKESKPLDDFWKATHAQDIPFTRLGQDDFFRATGGSFPLIVWVNDGKVEAKAEYINLSQKAIEDWVKK